MKPLTITIGPGELIDRITILQIKSERILDPIKLSNVRAELTSLERTRSELLGESKQLTELMAQLKAINLALWRIEDDIRCCERNGDFGRGFVELARAVYHQNDKRHALKRQLDQLFGSAVSEEKSYAAYQKSSPS